VGASANALSSAAAAHAAGFPDRINPLLCNTTRRFS
jgi:hypothetical protein